MTAGTSYTVTAGNGSCTSAASASFSVATQLPAPTAPTASVTTAPTCTLPTGTVTVSAPLGANYQYSINGGTTWQASPVFTGLTASASLTITVRDIASGCTSSGTMVNIPAITGIPSAPIGTTQDPTCILPGSITVSSPVGANYQYSINGGITWQASTTFAGLTAQSYPVIVQEVSSGCESSATVFTLSAPVGPTVTVSSGAIFSEGESITLTASGAVDYNWTPGTYLDAATGSTVIATPDQSMVYCVVGTDANGCTDTACVILTMEIECGNLFIPNVFSPNENSMDDELCILGAVCITDLVFRIYNRWGELVFETTDPAICWDGKFRSEYVSSGAYAYTFEGTNVNGESVKREGTITVLR
jgi:gliding motility-associated-like protein